VTAAWVLVHALAAVVFVNRYLGGLVVRWIRRGGWDDTVDDYVPTVTVVVPLYNEGAGIAAALHSVLDSDYPADRLRVGASTTPRRTTATTARAMSRAATSGWS